MLGAPSVGALIDTEVDRDMRYDHPCCFRRFPWVFAFSMQAEQSIVIV